jgi:hypothetical protein
MKKLITAIFCLGAVLLSSCKDSIEDTSAKEAEARYEFLKKNGTALETYGQAKIVAAMYQDAKDEQNYKKWDAIAKQEAEKAGVSP